MMKKIILISICIILFLTSNAQFSLTSFHASYAKPNFVTSELILRYELGNTNSYSGSGTTITDLMGNSNATIYNNPTYSSGLNGNLNLVGSSSQYVYINSNIGSFFQNTSTSIFLWIYPTGNGVILDERGMAHPGRNWFDSQIEMVSGTLKFSMWSYAFGTSLISSSIATPLNKWYYIGMVYDQTAKTLTAYINGQVAGTYSNFIRSAPYNNGYGLYYGIGYADATNQGDGTSGDFKFGALHVYRKALTVAEISLNYNSTKDNYGIIQNGLVMNLISPSSSGTTWTDLSGSGNNGTLIGSPTYVSANGGGYRTTTTSYISTNYNLPSTFTVSIAGIFTPSSYWATIWGNESWSAAKGYLAYFSSSGYLNIGSPSGQTGLTISGFNVVHIWDFVINGSSFTLYKDGVNVGTGTFTAPFYGSSNNGLYFGARHSNSGSSYTDLCPGTYYSMRVYNRALNASEITTNFNILRSSYGL